MAVEQPCSHLVFWNWDLINVAEKNKMIIFFFSLEKVYLFKQEGDVLGGYSKWMENKKTK